MVDGDPSQQGLSLTVPRYRGVDCNPWQCVDDLYYANKLSPLLKEIRRSTFKNCVGNFSPGASSTITEIENLYSVCEETSQCEILEIVSLGEIKTIEYSKNISTAEGFDCYVDGFGSLLALGIHENPLLFDEFAPRLNSRGIFNVLDDLREYVTRYVLRADESDLEPIDATAPIYVYTVSQLKRAVHPLADGSPY